MACQWADECLAIKDVLKDWSIPAVVKLEGDDYGNFGTGTQLDVEQPLLLYSVRRCCKVLAANMVWDERRGVYEDVGPALVIPVNYPGKAIIRCY